MTPSLRGAERPELTRLFPAGGQAGTSVSVEASGKFPVWPLQAWSDTEAIHWTFEETSGKLKATIAADAKPGLHWLRLYHPNGATAVRPFLVGNIPEQIESEPNDRVTEANAIASLPCSIHGVFAKRGDVDHYMLTLEQGQKIVAVIDSEHMLRSPVDASIQLLDAKGFVLAENLDHFGLDPRLEFTAPSAGKYLIRAFGFPSAPDSTISYGGGADWLYRLTLSTGDDAFQTRLRVANWDLECKSLLIESNQAVTREDALSFEVPAVIKGTLAIPGQKRFVRFPAVAGQNYRVQLQARQLGSALDASVVVSNMQSKQLSQQDDAGNNRDPDLKWKATADGDVLIEVKDFHLAGGPDFGYSMLVTAPMPDYKLELSTDSLQAVVGKETEIQVKIARELDFAGEITISLEGAPEGVECPTLKSIHGSDTAKSVTLKLKSTVAYQGPIRVVGKLPAEGAQTTLAETTDEKPIWLSITAE
ncbi:MAG: PPC domain-containing protein [Planctomycetota bacterium]|nr:PPC domain-containing protein [Planctomycetota bacterium]